MQDECVIELVNSDMDKGWCCKDWSLRLYFAGSNKTSQNPAIFLKNKARKLQRKTRFSYNFIDERTKVSISCQTFINSYENFHLPGVIIYFMEIMEVILNSVRSSSSRKNTKWTVSLNVKDTKVKDDKVVKGAKEVSGVLRSLIT